METLEEKKKEVIKKLMTVTSQKILQDIDQLLEKGVPDSEAKNMDKFIGILTPEEAGNWKKAIAET